MVTALTLAHSTTLALAALGVLDLPTRLVESAIALSVLLAAVLNLVPAAPRLGARLAFGFGLVHGLGFATALGDLGARDAGMLTSLLGFNAGSSSARSRSWRQRFPYCSRCVARRSGAMR